MKSKAHKIGAVFYIFWGAIHVLGGIMMMVAANDGVNSFIAAQTQNEQTVLVDASADRNSDGYRAAVGVFTFHAFNILWFGMLAIFIAVIMNWINSSLGFWLNAGIIGLVEIGLIIHITISGIDVFSGPVVGIALYLIALFFTALGNFSRQTA